MNNIITYTASQARENLYSLIKSASRGLKTFEIKLRGADSVVLINKKELEAWQETLDILSNPSELKAIRNAKKQKKVVSHNQLLKEIGLLQNGD